jgi:DNA topoisomerase-3
LIEIIQNELLKSAELTGSWEKQLKDIEKGTFTASEFINNMKRMVDALVYEVRSETTRANISHASQVKNRAVKAEQKKAAGILAQVCPKCKKARLIKGKSAFGCGNYKAGCDFVLPFSYADKKISENQYLRLLQKGSTVNLKDFKTDTGTVEGLLRFDADFKIVLEPKKTVVKPIADVLVCPKCKKGTVIKGNTAYGCSHYKQGCDFKVMFETVRAKINGQKPTKELVYRILRDSV